MIAAVGGRTKIVATLGPATDDEATIAALLWAGVNVVRLNFSHGAHDDHARRCAIVRQCAATLGLSVAVLQDLQGPKIRVGNLVGGNAVTLTDGATLRITTDNVAGTAARIGTTYAHLPLDVRMGDHILLDDGLMELRVTGVDGSDVVTTVLHGGILKAHKGINLPGVAISAPALTEKDRDDLAFGVELGVDYVALSFVRRPQDLRQARSALTKLGASTPLIAKIEKPEALDDLTGVIEAADGVMVARGDLGVELSPERVPPAQKRIIRLANERGKVVITATQMLESMTTNPRPTRAEASDVFNAILDGTDAVMLSGETAVGTYPVGAAQMMRRIASEAEAVLPARPDNPTHRRQTAAHALAEAASRLADDVRARALVVVTRSGYTARLLSSLRPDTPIFAVTESETVYRALALWWGVHAVRAPLDTSLDDVLTNVEAALVNEGMLTKGDVIVIVRSSANIATPHANLIKLSVVGADG